MVSIILNYYCYKTLLYEALVSEYNYGDVKREKTSMPCGYLFFPTEYIGIEYIECRSCLIKSIIQLPWQILNA